MWSFVGSVAVSASVPCFDGLSPPEGLKEALLRRSSSSDELVEGLGGGSKSGRPFCLYQDACRVVQGLALVLALTSGSLPFGRRFFPWVSSLFPFSFYFDFFI